MRSQVYCEGVRIGAEKVWNKMFQLYKHERVQVERERLLGALTCSRDSFTLKTFLSQQFLQFKNRCMELEILFQTFYNLEEQNRIQLENDENLNWHHLSPLIS